MERLLAFAKKRWTYILVAIIALFIGGAFGPSQDELDSSIASTDIAENKISKLEENEVELEKENKQLEAKVEEAAPYFELEEQERKNKEAAAKAKAAELKKKEAAAKAKANAKAEKAEREEAAKEAAAEAATKKKEAAAERKGYETGITYNQLARTPDDYIAEKVKFHGKVVQVMEADDTTQIRFAVDENYDNILFAEFDSTIVDSRILEDDVITIMGTSTGLLTYESTMGGDISIPGMVIEKIEQ